MKRKLRILLLALTLASLIATLSLAVLPSRAAASTTSETFKSNKMFDSLMNKATHFIVIKHKQLGGSHYAYTEGLAEELGSDVNSPSGHEAVFHSGSQLVLLSLQKDGDNVIKTEDVLINSPQGVVRDPDVSPDGKRLLFSWKKSSSDDFHLYEMELETRKVTQLTFGSGIADIEPKYTADGQIIFSSTRVIQTVDCWITPVSNTYVCNADGTGIVRLGYDQVHTTYPTVTSDNRVLYTRWDYNDRNQMYIQALFQMFPDGTNQTEVYGNNSNFPTTLLHTREIPDSTGKYISIAAGHHVKQIGKLVIIDTSVGRNNKNAVSFVFPDAQSSKNDNIDLYGVDGKVYKYPYAFNQNEFLVSTAASYTNENTAFDICFMNSAGASITLVKGTAQLPASQIVPIANREIFNRASLVDYSSSTGTYYVANVYEGEGLPGIEVGTVKYLRVVEIDYRASAIGATIAAGTGTSDPYSPIATGNGAWDVKMVLGIVPVEADGSAMFTVPANTPVYFQLLDENGDVIQTMRSWSTLMPNEIFSCVGCHEDKNTAPTANSKITLAMKKGVQELSPDLWMKEFPEYKDFDPYKDNGIGFSYLKSVQKILDDNCISCHSNTEAAYNAISVSGMRDATKTEADIIIDYSDSWSYVTTPPSSDWTKNSFDSSSWAIDHAPFGSASSFGELNTTLANAPAYFKRTAFISQYDLNSCAMSLHMKYSGEIKVYFNGTLVYSDNNASSSYKEVPITSEMKNSLVVGHNQIAVSIGKGTASSYFDLALKAGPEIGEVTVFISKSSTWSYKMSSVGSDDAGWNTSLDFTGTGWKTGRAPFGDRGGQNTSWTGSNTYIWIRQTFEIDDVSDFIDAILYMDVFYDDSAYFYLNGNRLFYDSGWVDNYTIKQLAEDASKHLVEGTNLFAVRLQNTAGGRHIDLSLYTVKGLDATPTNAPISFEGVNVLGQRQLKYFPLSYLVLTKSLPKSSVNWVGESVNRYTNWVSSMSRCEILKPYEFGANKSAIIQKLRTGHGGLTDAEIRTIACWIDLGVPAYGSYDENVNWNDNARREFEEKQNKREFYETLNKYAMLERAGLTPKGEISITYSPKGKPAITTKGEGLVTLYTTVKYEAGDLVKVVLPKGEHYLMLSLSSKMGESLIYLPTGTFTFIIPDLTKAYPNTMRNTSNIAYLFNTITARLATEDELLGVRNLAHNSYDSTVVKNAFPHVTANSVYNNQSEFEARNVIDGFTANRSHGTYPSQSWGPNSTGAHLLEINFGREVTLRELQIYIRADFPHDTHFTSVTVEFSDGTTMELSLRKTDEAQCFEIEGGKTTSFIKFKNFKKNDAGGWGALTEVIALGTEKTK